MGGLKIHPNSDVTGLLGEGEKVARWLRLMIGGLERQHENFRQPQNDRGFKERGER